MHWPYIHEDKIAERLTKERERERTAVQKVADEKFNRFVHTSAKTHRAEIEELQAEIASRDARIEQLLESLHDTEETYNEAINMERKARRVAADVEFQIDHFMQLFQKTFAAIHEIADRSSRHEEETRKNIESNRRKLRGEIEHKKG